LRGVAAGQIEPQRSGVRRPPGKSSGMRALPHRSSGVIARPDSRDPYLSALDPDLADRVGANGEERLVVLNRIAKSVVESVRGLHPVNVFVRAHKKVGESRPVTKMNNTAWKAARTRAVDAWAKEHGESAPAGFRKFAFTISNTPSAAGCGRRVCHSRIVRTCSGIAMVVSRRTTPRRNWRA
jgi:hypothetical protein